jgi:hypothetical protein
MTESEGGAMGGSNASSDLRQLQEILDTLKDNRVPTDRDEFNELIARIGDSGDPAAVPILQSTAEAADRYVAIYDGAGLGNQPGMWILKANAQEVAIRAREAIEKLDAAAPAEGEAPVSDSDTSGTRAADWYEDPSGKHQFRYWDGSAWTPHVADQGQQSTDPLEESASAAAVGAEAASEAGPAGGGKTIETVFREFIVGHEDEIQALPGTQSLEFIDLIRSLVNGGFTPADVQRVQMMPGRMGDLGREFLQTVMRETA